MRSMATCGNPTNANVIWQREWPKQMGNCWRLGR